VVLLDEVAVWMRGGGEGEMRRGGDRENGRRGEKEKGRFVDIGILFYL